MTESKKSSKQEELEKNLPHRACPICGVSTGYIYVVNEGESDKVGNWYKCQNGIIFQGEAPDQPTDNAEQVVAYGGANVGSIQEEAIRQVKSKSQHAGRTYAPLIEELTYGRMMLDVGFCADHNMELFKERGWLTWGIDINQAVDHKSNIFVGDFETADFDLKGKDFKKKLGVETVKREFDLIWMSHVFEHFKNPIAVLQKAYELLSETGVLYIATPEIDFLHKTGVPGWRHWKKDEHYILWSERALKRELERVGFNVIMARRNFSSRFVSWYDVHIIAQKSNF